MALVSTVGNPSLVCFDLAPRAKRKSLTVWSANVRKRFMHHCFPCNISSERQAVMVLLVVWNRHGALKRAWACLPSLKAASYAIRLVAEVLESNVLPPKPLSVQGALCLWWLVELTSSGCWYCYGGLIVMAANFMVVLGWIFKVWKTIWVSGL